jgi:hypothetical protein
LWPWRPSLALRAWIHLPNWAKSTVYQVISTMNQPGADAIVSIAGVDRPDLFDAE